MATCTLGHLFLLLMVFARVVMLMMVHVPRTYTLLLRRTHSTRLVIEGLAQVGLDCGGTASAVAYSCVHIWRSLLFAWSLTNRIRIAAVLVLPSSWVLIVVALLSLQWTLQTCSWGLGSVFCCCRWLLLLLRRSLLSSLWAHLCLMDAFGDLDFRSKIVCHLSRPSVASVDGWVASFGSMRSWWAHCVTLHILVAQSLLGLSQHTVSRRWCPLWGTSRWCITIEMDVWRPEELRVVRGHHLALSPSVLCHWRLWCVFDSTLGLFSCFCQPWIALVCLMQALRFLQRKSLVDWAIVNLWLADRISNLAQ